MSRDIETYVDLNEMLLNKLSDDEIHGARILFYDDEDKVQYQEDKAVGVDLSQRRTSIHARR